MKRKPQKNWTAEEIEILIDLYPSTSNKELATRLDRDIRSIANKAAHLNLQSKTNIKSKGVQRMKNNRGWSESDTNLLIELFPNTSNKAIAEKLGKSVSQVKNKARYLKLLKSENHKPQRKQRICDLFRKSDDVVEKVKALYPVARNKEIAAEIACGVKFVARVAKLFGLKKSDNFRATINGKKANYKVGNIIRHHGFLHIYCGKGQYEKLHLHNWRMRHGTIPAGHYVFFKDGNRDNCDISNLELVSAAVLYQRKKELELPETLRPLFRFMSGFKRIVAQRKQIQWQGGARNIARRFWTPEKISQLKSLINSKSKAEIGEIIGCSGRTIYNQAAKLKLEQKYRKQAEGGRPKVEWGQEKKGLLIKLYPLKTNDELAVIFGITKWSVKYQLGKLNLERPIGFSARRTNRFKNAFDWTDEKNQKLVEIYSLFSNPEIAENFGTSIYIIEKQARKLNLKKTRLSLNKVGSKIDPDLRSKISSIGGKARWRSRRKLHQDILERNGLSSSEYVLRTLNEHFLIKTPESQNFTRLHNFIWTLNHGDIPEKHVVVFKDGNPSNCLLDNLELITNSERLQRDQIASYPPELQSTVAALFDLKKAIKNTPRKSTRYKNPKTRVPWSDGELTFLKANYTRLTNEEVAEKLKRPADSVAAMKSRLGLKRCAWNTGGRRKNSAPLWTPENLSKFREIFPKKLNREVAAEFGVCTVTVSQKARELGISKGKGNIPESYLKANLQTQPFNFEILRGQQYAEK